MTAGDPLETVTHARLRAAQGDVRGARRIVGRILTRRPDDAQGLALAAELDGLRHAEPLVADDPADPPRSPAHARDLASTFRRVLTGAVPDRAERLRRWLRRIEAASADHDPGGVR